MAWSRHRRLAERVDSELDEKAAFADFHSCTSEKGALVVEPPLCAEDCIFFHLAKADQLATRFWAKRINALGVTPVQGLVLNFLRETDRITSSDLGRRAMLDSATLAGVLDRLEHSSLVVRDQHPDDRRAVLVCLTAAGRQLAAGLFACMQEANSAFLGERLTDEEQLILKMLLKKVRRAA